MTYRKGDYVEIPKDMSLMSDREKRELHKKQSAYLVSCEVAAGDKWTSDENHDKEWLEVLTRNVVHARNELERIRKALLQPQLRGLKG